jgi:hypothetical protein
VAELVSFYGAQRTVGEILRRMRCSCGCGGRVGAAWLVTGPILSTRLRPRRVALRGPEAKEWTPSASPAEAAAPDPAPLTWPRVRIDLTASRLARSAASPPCGSG